MDFIRPTTWAEALAAKAEHPDAVPINGGTDVMIRLSQRWTPPALLDLSGLAELRDWSPVDGAIRLGAGVTYRRIIDELSVQCPGLAAAARTVGSPQIRNRATVAGNLGTASPAGDAHPPLLASRAVVEATSVRGTRLIGIDDFFTGVKRNALAPDELIRAIRIPVATGPQQFSKVGPRNAMVIAVCSVAVTLDPAQRRVGTGIGSVAATPRRAARAEELAAAHLPWSAIADGSTVDTSTDDGLLNELAREFGVLVADAADPIDDVRGSAAYRRHSLAVLARRNLRWAWTELTGAGQDGGSSCGSS